MTTSNIAKVQRNSGLKKTDDDVIECASIHGVLVDLRTVSPTLRDQWRAAQRRVGKAEQAKAELDRVGETILQEQLIKHALATPIRGNHAVAKRLAAR
jgi:hypothetical protein